jgi:hypothetical protein
MTVFNILIFTYVSRREDGYKPWKANEYLTGQDLRPENEAVGLT